MHIIPHSFTIIFTDSQAHSLIDLTSKISGLVSVIIALGPNQVRIIGWYLRSCCSVTLACSVHRYKRCWICLIFVIFVGSSHYLAGITCCVTAIIHGGVDMSLARPTSPSRRNESIVYLERGVCSCAELQAFACYRG